MAPTRLISLLAIAAIAAGVAAFVAVGPADAAIGIVRWSAVGSDPTATINYRLNLPANSGTIQIKKASDNSVVKTIALGAGELADGPHSVVWDGTTDGGGAAPTGSYYATITVNRAAVPASPDYGRAFRIRDHSIQEPTAHRYFGVDADNNPANNNQADPSKSTFGNIYLANTVSKNIEVWLPGNPDAADYAACVIGNPDVLPGWTTGFTGGSSPWGLGVSRSGRVFSMDRSGSTARANWNWDGSDRKGNANSSVMGNTRDNDVIGLDPSDTGDGVYQVTVSSGPKLVVAKMGADYAPPAGYSEPKVLASTVAPPDSWTDSNTAQGVCVGNENATLMNTVWYIANANGWVKRWTTLGTGWADITLSQDTGFNLAVPGASDVSISPKNPNIAVVTRGVVGAGEKSIQVWDISTQTKIGEYGIGTSATSKVAFDAWGNALVVSGSYIQGVWAYLYELPDNGSTDSRDTIAFQHTGGNTPPVVESAAADPDTIPQDDATTTKLTIVVRDAEGFASISSVVVDLSGLGYSASTPAVKVSDDGGTRATFEVTGVKAKPASKAGLRQIPITATDSGGKTGAGTCPLTLTGGTLSGVVTHKTGLFPVAGVSVSATDGVNTYTGTTDENGAYTLTVNPGSFTVTASKLNYGAGTASSATSVALGGTGTPATDATVGSINIQQFRNAPLGSKVCVEAVVSAAGYTPVDEAYARPKFYLRDSSGAANNGLVTPTNNLGVRVYAPEGAPAPVEGDKVVVEGTKNLGAFDEVRLTFVTNYARVATGQTYPAPDAGVADDINDNVNNQSDARWGSLIRLSGVTVAGVTPDATTLWHELTVTDASSENAGLVIVWKDTGIAAAQLPKVGDIIDVTGTITRKESTDLAGRPNCIEPRKLADLRSAIRDVDTVGQAKAEPDNTVVNIQTGMVVTLASFAEPGVFYMQDAAGTAGIRVETGAATPNMGDTAKVSGRLNTNPATGERRLLNATFTVVGTGATKVRTLNNKTVGGQGYVGPAGTPADFGLSNQGLLVRVFGKVKKVDFFEGYFILDDGSNVDSGQADAGIKVTQTQAFPSVGDYLGVVGLVSSEIVDGKKIRVLRGREGQVFEDIQILAP